MSVATVQPEDTLLRLKHVAALLDLSPRQVQRLVRRKSLKQLDFGHRSKRFRRVDVDRLICRRAGESPLRL